MVTGSAAVEHLSAKGVSIRVEPLGGIIADMTVSDAGRDIAVLHRAPWITDGSVLPDGAPPHQARLAGDFFCAPFGDATADAAPLHGWPANGDWHRIATEGGRGHAAARWMLNRAVQGAAVIKELSLHDGHPFLYQRHIFIGGSGLIPVANHAMVSLPQGGHLRFSPKRFFETPGQPQESDPAMGRSRLAYPARASDPTAFPAADGGTVDLTRYPFGPAHEDFVAGIEQPRRHLGWTAVTRIGQGDLFLSLRNPQVTPMTMLWHSNGGRDYAPWSSRHKGCLGVEEGAALAMLAISGAEAPDPFTVAGQAAGLLLQPDEKSEVRHVIGMIAWPSGEPVRDVILSDDHLVVTGEGGATRRLPFRGRFLRLRD
jgi:hypothetical protein